MGIGGQTPAWKVVRAVSVVRTTVRWLVFRYLVQGTRPVFVPDWFDVEKGWFGWVRK